MTSEAILAVLAGSWTEVLWLRPQVKFMLHWSYLAVKPEARGARAKPL